MNASVWIIVRYYNNLSTSEFMGCFSTRKKAHDYVINYIKRYDLADLSELIEEKYINYSYINSSEAEYHITKVALNEGSHIIL